MGSTFSTENIVVSLPITLNHRVAVFTVVIADTMSFDFDCAGTIVYAELNWLEVVYPISVPTEVKVKVLPGPANGVLYVVLPDGHVPAVTTVMVTPSVR
jgi:hypothetical protein